MSIPKAIKETLLSIFKDLGDPKRLLLSPWSDSKCQRIVKRDNLAEMPPNNLDH